MKVCKAVSEAVTKGYERVWLVAKDMMLLAEKYLRKAESWKNTAVCPYVFEEYSNEEVVRTQKHPYIDGVLILIVEYNETLQKRACTRCRDDIKKGRINHDGISFMG